MIPFQVGCTDFFSFAKQLQRTVFIKAYQLNCQEVGLIKLWSIQQNKTKQCQT